MWEVNTSMLNCESAPWLDPKFGPRFEQAMQTKSELRVTWTDLDCTVIHHPTRLLCCTHTIAQRHLGLLITPSEKKNVSLLNQRNPGQQVCSWNHIWKKRYIKQQKEKLGTLTATPKVFNSRLSSLGVIRYRITFLYIYIFWKINMSSSVQRNKQVHLFIVYPIQALAFKL